MKSLFCALLVLPLTLVAINTVRADDAKPVESAYYPLKDGSVWHYKAGEAKIDVKVAKHEEVDKQLCARLETSVAGNVVASEHVAVKNDGVYRFSIANNKVTPPLKFIALPFLRDQSWKVDSASGNDKVTGTFTSGIVDEVIVPAGTFKDVHTSIGDVMVGGTKISFTYFLAKDFGMIKQIIKISGQGQEIVIELEKFEPGN